MWDRCSFRKPSPRITILIAMSCCYSNVSTYSAVMLLCGPIFLVSAFFLSSLQSSEQEMWLVPSSWTSFTSTMPPYSHFPITWKGRINYRAMHWDCRLFLTMEKKCAYSAVVKFALQLRVYMF